MVLTSTGTGTAPGTIGGDLNRTAHTTGLLYLALFITGISGSLLVRGQLFVADDAQGTLSNLMAHGSVARVGIVLELGIVLTQALTAVWFNRLFRGVDERALTVTTFCSSDSGPTALKCPPEPRESKEQIP